MKNVMKNNKGFSLIELMVVVAIIGILAAVGIPQYSKFQSKARTGEAKAALSALFTGERSFQLEWNGYTVDLRNAGVGVEGTNLRYVTGFSDGTACTALAPGMPAEVLTQTQTISTGVATAGTTWLPAVAATGVPATIAIIPVAGTTCTLVAFRALSVGDPRSAPALLTASGLVNDRWQIDNTKSLTNPASLL